MRQLARLQVGVFQRGGRSRTRGRAAAGAAGAGASALARARRQRPGVGAAAAGAEPSTTTTTEPLATLSPTLTFTSDHAALRVGISIEALSDSTVIRLLGLDRVAHGDHDFDDLDF